MIVTSNIVGIVADDLTGANDTALQFHLQGANTQILLSNDVEPLNIKNTKTWAVSTESRNISQEEAFQAVKSAAQMLVDKINPDYFYKKIDSTLRGNIAVEVLALLDTLNWDAAVVVPAFPQEGRITVGGYHLLKGVPIERTEMARDPRFPIFESHIPTLFDSQLDDECKELIGTIELKTVMNGAGPILMELNNLIASGKKLIIADAVSTVDIEQLALAINKSDYNILPAGTAAFARSLAELWFVDLDNSHIVKTFPELPKLIISGSANQISTNQIKTLENSDDIDALVISLNLENIMNGVTDALVERIVSNLGQKNTVLVHTSQLIQNFDGFSEDSLNAELTREKLAILITDYLAELTRRVIEKREVILVTLGGETSYKCCNAIGANQLQLIDEVVPAIALCMDHNAQWIVTKSGNLGNANTLIDILKYFESHESSAG